MMRFTWSQLSEPIDLSAEYIRVLVLESPSCFREFSMAVASNMAKKESKLILSKDYEPISFEKYVMVVESVLDTDPNQKKILTKIYDNLFQTAMSEDFFTETAALQEHLYQYMGGLLHSSALPLCYDELNFSTLLKSIQVVIDLEQGSFIERLCHFMDVVCDVLKQEIFVFYHLKSYLEEDELRMLYQHCMYRKYQVLVCEPCAGEPLAQEKITIIDKDLCRIT